MWTGVSQPPSLRKYSLGVSKCTSYQNSSPRLGPSIVIIKILASANPFVFYYAALSLEVKKNTHIPLSLPPTPARIITTVAVLSIRMAALLESKEHHSHPAPCERYFLELCCAKPAPGPPEHHGNAIPNTDRQPSPWLAYRTSFFIV